MLAKRLFPLFVVITMMVTAASAQSKWGSRGARHAAPTQDANANAGSPSAEDDDRNSLEGTWRTTESFSDGSVFRVLFTFSAGKNANNGTDIHSDELFFVPSPSCLSAQGVWKRTGERRFIATDEGFCFNSPNFDPFGKIKFKSAIKLNNQGT